MSEGSGEQIDWWSVAAAAGIDMSLVEANLRRTVEERIRAHARALNLALELRAAVKSQREQCPKSNPC
jgi:hypothetical protein